MTYLLYFYSYLMLDQCELNNASCYGALTVYPMDRCCPTCRDVKMSYQNMEWNLAPTNVIQCSGKFISLQSVGYVTARLSFYIRCKSTNHASI